MYPKKTKPNHLFVKHINFTIMPTGTIRDPKMNPREKAYGIIYINELGGHFKYFKSKGKNRLWLAGEIIMFAITTDQQITYYNTPRTIDGISVIGEIEKDLNFAADPNLETNAPVINYMKTTLENSEGGWDVSNIKALVPDSDIE